MNKIAERVLVQALISKSPVKTLNRSVLSRFVWLDKTQFNAMLKSPLIKRAAGEFRPLISSYRSWIALRERNTVQDTRDMNA